MSDEKPSDRPRTPARKKLFASGPIRGITNDDEAIKCRIILALNAACDSKIYKRIDLREMFSVGKLQDVDPDKLMALIDELQRAKAVHYDQHMDQIKFPHNNCIKRARESEMALALWTKGKRKQ